MNFQLDPRTEELRSQLQAFMDEHVYPSEPEWRETVAGHEYPLALIDGLKEKAKRQGLWNLFIPGLRDDEPGTRLTNLEYAPLAEIMDAFPGARRCSTAARPTPATWRSCISSPRPSSASAGSCR